MNSYYCLLLQFISKLQEIMVIKSDVHQTLVIYTIKMENAELYKLIKDKDEWWYWEVEWKEGRRYNLYHEKLLEM